MKRDELWFQRPDGLEATTTPEDEGRSRDDVRLLVSTPDGHVHAGFRELPCFLRRGDLLVVNESATVAASLVARGEDGELTLNVSTRFGPRMWLAEPRWGPGRPGPVPLDAGDRIETCAGTVLVLAPYPGADRLWFVEGDLELAMARCGEPIRYGYISAPQTIDAYQSIFSRVPGSSEMPSAARPFTQEVVSRLREGGVALAVVRLHTGVSSLEVTSDDVEDHPLPPEPFCVSARAAAAVNETRANGGRVIAVGTTVVRALESAWRDGRVEPAAGFTRVVVHPSRGVHAVDGLLTGFHDPGASHVAMLYAVAGSELVRDGYRQAVEHAYRWHEFGDSHLLLPN